MKIYIGLDGHGIKRTIGQGNTHTEALADVRYQTLGYLVDHVHADDYDQWEFKEKERC